MQIDEIKEAQDMLAQNSTSVVEDFSQWLVDADLALEGLLGRLPVRLKSDASMMINRIRAALTYARDTEVPILLGIEPARPEVLPELLQDAPETLTQTPTDDQGSADTLED